jgi:hypothetical protein
MWAVAKFGSKGGAVVKTIGLMMWLVGAAGAAMAGVPTATPEIDAATGVGALVLLSGALLVIRSRRKR